MTKLDYRRTYNCGTLTASMIGETVTLAGWVNRRRDHGGLIFIDLRDRFGLTQLVFNPDKNPECHTQAEKLRSEYVIAIKGEVIPRAEGMKNPNMHTGEIEVMVSEMEVLSTAKTPPFSVCDEMIQVNEEIRLKYRYLDMRRGEIGDKLITRHKAMLSVRNYLDQEGFLEIATPILGKSTPEGARDYLVPSRIYPGNFYALPQSPQIFKQLLMVGGMDRYFQIAPCFRDEDLRADRQPEFSQIDLEMSFSTTDELFPLIESLLRKMFKDCGDIDISSKFRSESYDWCIENYGTDKPDLRFGMPLVPLNDIAERSNFSVFKDQISGGGIVKGLCVKGGADISRKGIDQYTEFVGHLGIKGLAWMKMQEEGQLSSSIVKFFSEELQKELIERFKCVPGDLIFMIADDKGRVNLSLDQLRRKIARDRDFIDSNHFEFLWVTDFPLMTWDAESHRLETEHHPFTAPLEEDIPLLDSDPLKVRSSSYDLVLNGYEIASGSQRIHDSELQHKIFEILKLSEEELNDRFGFFINALKYGTPPHLGIALGVERLMMIISRTENIRDVIAFPKTQKAADLMMNSPSVVDHKQLLELGVSVEVD
ncbi:MAG: Aspartate--tRNA(Asp/Asn) ligase [Chlamydiae bacterium]|nr:Aspartate--tRNA(Asp/Asn) ligase [Chlamydiota bacterium]